MLTSYTGFSGDGLTKNKRPAVPGVGLSRKRAEQPHSLHAEGAHPLIFPSPGSSITYFLPASLPAVPADSHASGAEEQAPWT